MSATTVKPASEKQVAFIARLLTQREVSEITANAYRALAAETTFTSRQASSMIDTLMGEPWKPREGQRQDGTPAGVGVYQRAGRIFVVREFTPQGEDRKVRYAREIVALRAAQGDRLNEAGATVRYQEIKAPRMQWELKDSELVPMAELDRLGVQFGHCLVCGTKLEVAESVKRGIGPVCAKRQQARLAGMAA